MKSLAVIVIAVALAACGKDKSSAPAAGSATGSAPGDTGSGSAAGSAAPAGSNADSGSAVAAEEPVDVPTEMDYEELAAEDITDKTVEARLKELETQLTAQ